MVEIPNDRVDVPPKKNTDAREQMLAAYKEALELRNGEDPRAYGVAMREMVWRVIDVLDESFDAKSNAVGDVMNTWRRVSTAMNRMVQDPDKMEILRGERAADEVYNPYVYVNTVNGQFDTHGREPRVQAEHLSNNVAVGVVREINGLGLGELLNAETVHLSVSDLSVQAGKKSPMQVKVILKGMADIPEKR